MAEDEGRRNRPPPTDSADADLEKAMRLSREEDEKRKAALQGNQNGLFDADPQQRQSVASLSQCIRADITGRSDQLIDFNSQPQQQIMPQYTGAPQFNSYNPYAAQQQAQQEEYMRMQQQLEMQRQMEAQNQQAAAYQQMLQNQAYMQQAQFLQPQQTAAPLIPQHTSYGSNNPFASFAPASPPQQQQQPPLPSFNSSPNLDAFTSQAMSAANSMQRPASQPAQAQPKRSQADEQHAQLAALLGSGGSGIDTYGNVGNLRLPACVRSSCSHLADIAS
jgi:epsin